MFQNNDSNPPPSEQEDLVTAMQIKKEKVEKAKDEKSKRTKK